MPLKCGIFGSWFTITLLCWTLFKQTWPAEILIIRPIKWLLKWHQMLNYHARHISWTLSYVRNKPHFRTVKEKEKLVVH